MQTRERSVAGVLQAVTVLSRAITAEQRAPFDGRGLTRTQMQTLYVLAHAPAPVTPSRLAQTLGVTAGAVTQLVDGLRDEDLVAVVPNPDDARSRIIRLTSGAAAEVESFEAAIVQRLEPLFESLEDEELRTLAALLHRVAAPL